MPLRYLTNLIIENAVSSCLMQESCAANRSPMECWKFPHFSQARSPQILQCPRRFTPSAPQ